MSAALDRFFDHYYRCRPVNATFTGVHDHDDRLPDWSPDGLAALDDEMASLIRELNATHPVPRDERALGGDVDALDAELARSFLEIQRAEHGSAFGVRGNPSLWVGEAVFGVISLMIREFAPMDQRVESAIARLEAVPGFLAAGQATMAELPIAAAWCAKASKEVGGALTLLENLSLWLRSAGHDASLDRQLHEAAQRAATSFREFREWLDSRSRPSSLSCGPDFYDLLLARGHHTRRTRGALLAEARERFGEERARLDELAAHVGGGGWAEVQSRLADDHPAAENFLETFARTWQDCHERAASADVVTWPDWPIRYVPFPSFTAAAAPSLYYLYYRSPAPFDSYDVYDYVVPPTPEQNAEAFLRAWNNSTIKLNHVVHHGAIGHHVQNWHASHRAPSRVGQIAAVDCASRIGMFCGGSMAEGWACYATGLMEELGFLSPLERVAEQHSRVRFLARAIVDIELHQGTMDARAAEQLYVEQVGMSADVARAEVVKNSMFPGTAVMYWLGTQTILDLRSAMRGRTLKQFHDELLGFGSIPVPLIARIMGGSANA